MLDNLTLPHVNGFSKYQGSSRSATEFDGPSIAKMRSGFNARVRLARGLIEGSATVVNLTPAQAAHLCRVPRSALCAEYRQRKPKSPPVTLDSAWDGAPLTERQDLLLSKVVIPLAD